MKPLQQVPTTTVTCCRCGKDYPAPAQATGRPPGQAENFCHRKGEVLSKDAVAYTDASCLACWRVCSECWDEVAGGME